MRLNKFRNTLAFCLGLLLVGVLIQAAGWLKGDRLVFPDVGEILAAFVRLLGTGKVWKQIGTTLLHLAEALAVSSVIGTALGLVQGRSPFVRTLLRPLMILLRSVPMIVMTVIIMVLTRYENVPLIATSLMLIPLISEATCEGFLRIEPELVEKLAKYVEARADHPEKDVIVTASPYTKVQLTKYTSLKVRTVEELLAEAL